MINEILIGASENLLDKDGIYEVTELHSSLSCMDTKNGTKGIQPTLLDGLTAELAEVPYAILVFAIHGLHMQNKFVFIRS